MNLASFSAPLHHHAWICAGHKPRQQGCLGAALYNPSFGKNQVAAAYPTGETWESWCQRHGAWERCGFGRRTVASLHNCAKYSSCDKTLQYITGLGGARVTFPLVLSWCLMHSLAEMGIWTKMKDMDVNNWVTTWRPYYCYWQI